MYHHFQPTFLVLTFTPTTIDAVFSYTSDFGRYPTIGALTPQQVLATT